MGDHANDAIDRMYDELGDDPPDMFQDYDHVGGYYDDDDDDDPLADDVEVDPDPPTAPQEAQPPELRMPGIRTPQEKDQMCRYVLSKTKDLGGALHNAAVHGSQYVKFASHHKVGSLRISDHEGRAKYHYKWNLRADYDEISEERTDVTLRRYYPWSEVDQMIEDMHTAAGIRPGAEEYFGNQVGAPASIKLSNEEMRALQALKELHEALRALPPQHPHELQTYALKVHELKSMIALRHARKIDPALWPTYKKGKDGVWVIDNQQP